MVWGGEGAEALQALTRRFMRRDFSKYEEFNEGEYQDRNEELAEYEAVYEGKTAVINWFGLSFFGVRDTYDDWPWELLSTDSYYKI